jgi:hypothetical protein
MESAAAKSAFVALHQGATRSSDVEPRAPNAWSLPTWAITANVASSMSAGDSVIRWPFVFCFR